MIEYPQSAPVDDVVQLIAIIRAGETSTKRPELFQRAWSVQGYCQKLLIGEVEAPAKQLLLTDGRNPEFLARLQELGAMVDDVGDRRYGAALYQNDILDFLSEHGFEALYALVKPILQFIYNLFGAELHG